MDDESEKDRYLRLIHDLTEQIKSLEQIVMDLMAQVKRCQRENP